MCSSDLLSDHVVSRNAWNDRTLLNSRGFLETISIDSAKQIFIQFHLIKTRGNLEREFKRTTSENMHINLNSQANQAICDIDLHLHQVNNQGEH